MFYSSVYAFHHWSNGVSASQMACRLPGGSDSWRATKRLEKPPIISAPKPETHWNWIFHSRAYISQGSQKLMFSSRLFKIFVLDFHVFFSGISGVSGRILSETVLLETHWVVGFHRIFYWLEHLGSPNTAGRKNGTLISFMGQVFYLQIP